MVCPGTQPFPPAPQRTHCKRVKENYRSQGRVLIESDVTWVG